MPTENKPADPGFDLNTPDGGRGYIAHLFKTVLKRHDYRQHINERLAGDFACTLAQHLEASKAREHALQLRLNAADQRNDELTGAATKAREVLRTLLRDKACGTHYAAAQAACHQINAALANASQ